MRLPRTASSAEGSSATYCWSSPIAWSPSPRLNSSPPRWYRAFGKPEVAWRNWAIASSCRPILASSMPTIACAYAVGHRSSTVCASVLDDLYSRFLRAVAVASATHTIPSSAGWIHRSRPPPVSDRVSDTGVRHQTPPPASATIAASARYIRRSAPTSVAIGTMLDVGASVMKIHAPRKPSIGRCHNASAVNASSAMTTSAYGHPSPSVIGCGVPYARTDDRGRLPRGPAEAGRHQSGGVRLRPDRDRAHARVHRQQVEQRHHRLGSLRHVVDNLGVQRMQRPDERDGKRDVDRVRLKPDTRTATSYETEPRELERATHQPEQDHGAQQMDGEVRDVVAADAHAAERVVDRERHVDDRPAGGRHFALRK